MTKIVFLAGTKSHGPGDHEYEKGLRLLAKALAPFAQTEVHLYGWPEDEKTLDDADCIVLYADGSDHNESDHPLLLGNQMAVMEKRRRAYDHAHQNWEIITRWCNDVWLNRQRVKRGCPPPVDYTETGPFHPPHSHPREPFQFEENYLHLERWARPSNVCWSGGIHIANKKILEREENNLLTVERWANTMSFGLLFTPGCVGQ